MFNYSQRIRDHMNGSMLSHLLRKDAGRWNQMCSSIDVIEDSALAIDAYGAIHDSVYRSNANQGIQYLALYGVLQALFLQQDASSHLCEALEIPFDLKCYPRLGHIRDVRNASIGHPTKKRTKAQLSYHFVSRISISNQGFTLLSSFAVEGDRFEHIDVASLIGHQREDVGDVLSTVVAELDKRAHELTMRFKDVRLADAFSPMLDYAFEKIGEAVRGSKPREMGLAGVVAIEEAMEAFRAALAERDMELETFDAVKDAYEDLEYALPELKGYLAGEESDIKGERIARILADFVCRKAGELRDLARDIDADDGS